MFKKWKVLTITRNISDGESHEYDDENTTEKDAMDAFYDNCSKFGTNPATKTCAVYVIAPTGAIHRMELIDNTKYKVEE